MSMIITGCWIFLHLDTSDIGDIRLAGQAFVSEPAAVVVAGLAAGLVAGPVASAAAASVLRFEEPASEGASAALSPDRST